MNASRGTLYVHCLSYYCGRGQLKCDGARPETRFRLSAKRTSPFKSAGGEGWSVQSTTGSRVVRISGSNAGYTNFRSGVKTTGYPLHSPVSPSIPFPCVTVCHHISTGLYALRALPVLLLWYRPTNLDRTALTSVSVHANRFADGAKTDCTCAELILTVVILGST